VRGDHGPWTGVDQRNVSRTLIAREQGASLRLLHVGGVRRRKAQVHEALEDFRKQVHARVGIAS